MVSVGDEICYWAVASELISARRIHCENCKCHTTRAVCKDDTELWVRQMKADGWRLVNVELVGGSNKLVVWCDACVELNDECEVINDGAA